MRHLRVKERQGDEGTTPPLSALLAPSSPCRSHCPPHSGVGSGGVRGRGEAIFGPGDRGSFAGSSLPGQRFCRVRDLAVDGVGDFFQQQEGPYGGRPVGSSGLVLRTLPRMSEARFSAGKTLMQRPWIPTESRIDQI